MGGSGEVRGWKMRRCAKEAFPEAQWLARNRVEIGERRGCGGHGFLAPEPTLAAGAMSRVRVKERRQAVNSRRRAGGGECGGGEVGGGQRRRHTQSPASLASWGARGKGQPLRRRRSRRADSGLAPAPCELLDRSLRTSPPFSFVRAVSLPRWRDVIDRLQRRPMALAPVAGPP